LQRSLKELKQSPVRSTQIGDQIRGCSGLLRTCLFKEATMAKPVPPAPVIDAPAVPSIVAGIGCRRGADADEIIALLEHALAAADCSASALVALASLDRKADEPGLLAAAAYFCVPLRTFAPGELNTTGTMVSATVRALVGTSSVAEAAARRAGPLIAPRLKSARVTCALAATGPDFRLGAFGQAVPGMAPASTASIAASRSLTSNAGP
jgi:cobalt-precorrin 5A hydrolase/precorrin-3B C17-methyltransferase